MIFRVLTAGLLLLFTLACGEPNAVVVNTTPGGDEPTNTGSEDSNFAERFAAVYEVDTAPIIATFAYTCACASNPNNELCDDLEGDTSLETRVECLRQEFKGMEPPAAMEPYLQCYEDLMPQRQQCLELLEQATEACSGIPDCIETFDADSTACDSFFSEEVRQWLGSTGVFETCGLI